MREKLQKMRSKLFGRIGRLLMLVILLSIVGLTAVFSFGAQHSIRQHSIEAFDRDRTASDQHFLSSMQHYGDLLYQSRSFLQSSQNVTQEEWKAYYKSQDVFGRYAGVSSVYFAKRFGDAEKAAFVNEMRKQPDFGGTSYDIRPAGKRDTYIMSTLYTSINDVRSGLNFDLYSTPDRQHVYDTALKTDVPIASAPLTFATGAKGFFVVLPVKDASDKLLGYVGLSFRSEQLFHALYNRDVAKDMDIRISETDDNGKPVTLYQSQDWDKHADAKLVSSDTFEIAGRTWTMDYRASDDYDADANGRFLPWAITMAGSLLAIILAIALYLLFRAEAGESAS